MTDAGRPVSWKHALWLVIPSLLAAALSWQQLHSPPITYVAFLTTWLFALVAVAAAHGP
ncbi:MAG TPA: hypothetical protein VK034_30090 [Enhygromyxa sp.]|nr:hypothetical protein [Enhygromyxa sp.]